MSANTPYAGVASIFRSALAARRAPRVFEDGRQLRDFIHVDDVARANLLALTAEQPIAGAYNIATGEPRTVGEMATTLATICNGPEPIVTGEFRLGDVRHVFASPRRAEAALDFRASVSFQDGMRAFAAA